MTTAGIINNEDHFEKHYYVVTLLNKQNLIITIVLN